MSDEAINSVRLDQVLEKYAALSLQQNAATNQKVDTLVENVSSMADKMGSLAEIIAKQEERHLSHSENNGRLEKVQIEQGREFKRYKAVNDDRMMNVEKQVLLLDVSDKRAESRFTATDKRNAAIITAVLIALIVGLLGLR